MLKRLRMVFRSMFGWLLRRVEDPELILRQHIDDLRARIPEFNRQAAEVVKLEKMLQMQHDRLTAQVGDLEAKVRAAVKLGPEKKELAKSLIAALETAKIDLTETAAQLEQARRNSEQVKRARLQYERRVQQEMQEAMHQISRAKRAEMQKQMADLMMSFEVGDDRDVLQRMTERIDEELARAEARQEIAAESVGAQIADIEADVLDQAAEEKYREYQRQLGLLVEEAPVEKSLEAVTEEQPTQAEAGEQTTQT